MKSVGESGELHFPLSRWRERAGVRVAREVVAAFGCTTLTRRAVRVGLSRQRERRECEHLRDLGQRA